MANLRSTALKRIDNGDSALVDRYLPGLQEALHGYSLSDLESPGNPALKLFKAAGGTGLLIGADRGGVGIDAVTAVEIQSAVSAISPSLGVATMMHHLSVASFSEFLTAQADPDAPEWGLLTAIAENNLLVASASGEARRGAGILTPTTTATAVDGGFILRGSKKPCSLSASMDILTCSVHVHSTDEYNGTIAMAVVFAGTPNVHVKPFWKNSVLGGAESDEIALEDVFVPNDLVILGSQRPGQNMDELQKRGWVWFELLAAASYIGVAKSLVARATQSESADHRILGQAVSLLHGCTSSLDTAARALSSGANTDEVMVHSLLARNFVQSTVPTIALAAAEIAGGTSFASDSDGAYLLAASRALAFHPPRQPKSLEALGRYFAGHSLDTSIF